MNEPRGDQTLPQRQLSLQDPQCPRTQLHPSILSGLRLASIDARHPRLADAENAVLHIEIG
jgi:hypothetical protein